MTRRPLILVALAVAAMHLAALTDLWVVKPDSGLYLGLGQSLAEGRGMAFNGAQWWGIPPVVPFLVAGCRWLVGDHLWLINLVMGLFGLGVVVVSYPTLRRLAADLPERLRPGLAVGGLLVVATSARLFVDSKCILTDVPFAFFIMLSLYFWVRARDGHWAWSLLASAALVLAMLTRIVGPVLAAAVAMAALLESLSRPDRGKRLLVLAGGLAIMVGGFALWVVLLRSRAEAGSVDYLASKNVALFNVFTAAKWREIGQGLLALPGALTSTIVYQKLPYINLVPTALVLVGAWTAARRRQWLVVLLPVVYLGFLLALGAAVASRYLLPVMPLVVYCLLLGAQVVVERFRRWCRPADEAAGRPSLALAVTVGLCAAISLARVGREIYWLRHPRCYEVLDHGQWVGLLEAGRYLRAQGRPGVDRVLGPQLYVLHYTSGLLATTAFDWERRLIPHFEDLPPEKFAAAAVEGGYRFVVVPTDSAGWSGPALEALRATGRFGDPPQRFADLAVLERRDAPSGAPRGPVNGAAR